MTLFGKILIFINLALSVLMAGWALAMYSQRIDWSTPVATEDTPQGEVFKRQDEVQQRWKLLDAAEKGWEGARAELGKLERQRPENQKWYAEELKKPLADPATLKTVKFKDGRPVPDPDPKRLGLPILEDAKDRGLQPLRSRAAYEKELGEQIDAVVKALKELEDASKEDGQLTEKLTGDKGLIQRQENERIKFERVVAELKNVEDSLTNNRVESESILKRYNQLKARVAELKGQGVATR